MRRGGADVQKPKLPDMTHRPEPRSFTVQPSFAMQRLLEHERRKAK